jgi:hypothetical protein
LAPLKWSTAVLAPLLAAFVFLYATLLCFGGVVGGFSLAHWVRGYGRYGFPSENDVGLEHLLPLVAVAAGTTAYTFL